MSSLQSQETIVSFRDFRMIDSRTQGGKKLSPFISYYVRSEIYIIIGNSILGTSNPLRIFRT